ncbi:hypothetical protein FQN54_005261 [Arachnomyces sp. PD_36]|nr:hypothetical protein FQN54_005261 [Arachnomyces sp. PD_36]
MRLLAVAAVSAFLVAPACALSAKNILGSHARVYQRQEIDDAMYREADAVLARVHHQKRDPLPQQTATGGNAPDQSATPSNTGVDSGGNFDEVAFNSTATEACLRPLQDMTSVVNPSGMAACYNIPFLDNATGVFEADIRLYRITQPNSEFTGIQPTDLSLGVMIPKASLSNPRALGAGSSGTGTAADTGGMKLLEEFQHVGQINTDLMVGTLDEQSLRILLTPNITVSAQNNGKLVETTLSSDTISYVAGRLVDPSNNPSNITVPEASAQLAAVVDSATPFVLPGQTLGIFPTGLIITCAWTLIFILAVGYGTFCRMKFRAHYRRRVLRAETFRPGPGGI